MSGVFEEIGKRKEIFLKVATIAGWWLGQEGPLIVIVGSDHSQELGTEKR